MTIKRITKKGTNTLLSLSNNKSSLEKAIVEWYVLKHLDAEPNITKYCNLTGKNWIQVSVIKNKHTNAELVVSTELTKELIQTKLVSKPKKLLVANGNLNVLKNIIELVNKNNIFFTADKAISFLEEYYIKHGHFTERQTETLFDLYKQYNIDFNSTDYKVKKRLN